MRIVVSRAPSFSTARKEILRAVEKLGARLTTILITHAHADHFGGVAELVKRAGATVYAPRLEADIVEAPIWEPLYLCSGAAPIQELRRKFTLAPAGVVHHRLDAGAWSSGPFRLELISLYGHAPRQLGALWGDVLFTADAFFPIETLEKHGIPFCVDMDEALRTLTWLEGTAYRWYAPGHGPAIAQPAALCAANRQRLEEIRALCLERTQEPAQVADVIAYVTGRLGVTLRDATAFLLSQTTILAALTSLQRAGQVVLDVSDNRLWWKGVGNCRKG